MHCKHSSRLVGYTVMVLCFFYSHPRIKPLFEQKKRKKGTSNKKLILKFKLVGN